MAVPKLRFKGFSDEWKTGHLRNNFSSISTNSYSRSLLNYHTGDVKNIHYGDIHVKFKSHFKVSSENVPYINDDVKISYSEECYCRKGDLIFADASEDLNDIGKSIEIIDTNEEKILAGLHTVHLRSHGNEFATGFGGYLLKTNSLIRQIQKEAQGAKVLGISASKILGLKYCSPSLEEQEKIAQFFTTVDDKLESLKKKKELLEQYKKGVMQKIFSQELRFKDEKGKDFPEWEEKKVKDCFTITRGNVLSMTQLSGHAGDNIYPVFSSQTKNKGLAGFYHKFLFQDAITWTTDGANAGDVNFRKGKFYCTNVCGVLLSEKGEANPAIAAILNSVAKRYVSYVGNPKLMNNVMAEIKINVPTSLLEQQKIADYLTALDDKIALVEQQINKTELWKKGLLQQMFV